MSRAASPALRANLAALRLRSPELAALVEGSDPLRFELAPSRAGAPSATVGGAWLHSRYDPEAEAGRIIDEALAAGADFALVLGMGLGYAARAGLAAGARVAVVDPDPASLRAGLEAVDLADIIGDPRCSILVCPGGKGLDSYLAAEAPRSVATVENAAILSAFPEAAAALRAQASAYRRKVKINAATLERFGRLWARNLIRNLETAAGFPGVAGLAGAFAGIPALVLAAGPSLDEALPALPELRERCVVVAVDTALRSALAAGVEPDFVVVVDPQYWNARHLDSCASPSSVLVTEAAVWPSVLRFEARATALCSSIYPLGRYVEERLGVVRGALGAGGSVATTAWDFARIMGCSPIYMAGLDLSFPGAKTHAKASLFEQKSIHSGTRRRPAASAGFEAMMGGNPFAARANDGSTVVSDERLAFYSSWFAARLASGGAPPTFNLSAKGLAIDGMPYRPASEIGGLPAARARVDAAVEGLSAKLHRSKVDPGAARAVAVELTAELERIALLAERAAAEAAGAIGSRGAALDDAIGRLAAFDSEVLKSSARDVIGFFFPSPEKAVGGRAKTVDESLKATARLYEAVAESARWHALKLAERFSNERATR